MRFSSFTICRIAPYSWSLAGMNCFARRILKILPSLPSLNASSALAYLLHFQRGDNVTAGRIFVTKRELLAPQIFQRIDAGTCAGDEDRMVFQVVGALDEWNDSMLGMGADIVHRSQAGKIDGAVRKAG